MNPSHSTRLQDILTDQVGRSSNHLALIYQGSTYTYEKFLEQCEQTARGLWNLGLRKNDRLAILSTNCPEYLFTYFAAASIGVVCVPLNYRLSVDELAYILEHSESKALIYHTDYQAAATTFATRLPSIQHYIRIDEDSAQRDLSDDNSHHTLAWCDLPTEIGDTDTPPEPSPDDLVYQMYTSGTTGLPKGAMLSHRNVTTNIAQVTPAFRLDKHSRHLIPAPVYHAAASICSFCTLAAGGTIILKPGFDPDDVAHTVESERISHALLLPVMIAGLLAAPSLDKIDLKSLRYVIYGASPTPEPVLRRAIEALGCEFIQAYGQTEAVAVLTVLEPEDHVVGDPAELAKRLQSCGRAVERCEVRIVDENLVEVPSGELGEIVAQGDHVMCGYFKMPEETERTLDRGWLRTGDIGTKDDAGYLYLIDRAKDMIVSGGENIYPKQIEDVLHTHETVAEAAVIGVPSECWGEEIKAFVALFSDKTASEEELIAHCKARLGGFKVPRSVEFIESLPRNASGKVLKKNLREPYWRHLSRRIN